MYSVKLEMDFAGDLSSRTILGLLFLISKIPVEISYVVTSQPIMYVF